MSLHMKPVDASLVKTPDPFELSARILAGGAVGEPTNRTSNAITEFHDDLAVVESFSHLYAFRTDDGLVCFDASSGLTGAAVTGALRSWDTAPVTELIYTHGHLDHVGGSGALAADGRERGHRPPRVLAHEAVVARLERYRSTAGYNRMVNLRQFGGVPAQIALEPGGAAPEFLAPDTLWPTTTYSDRTTSVVGGTTFELHHGRGETDDHTWTWVPRYRALVTGDFVCWVFPNAGNPQKVQRYPLEWAAVLRRMQAHDAELLLPAHGLPVRGREHIQRLLGDVAGVLEFLVAETLTRMNAGMVLDDIVHDVRVPDHLLELPWLQPVYDEPEFVVRNIWRLYGGWWDQDPATLKPAPRAQVAHEVVGLAGGVAAVVARAEQLAAEGDLRMACHLIEFAAQADPTDRAVHAVRAAIYRQRRGTELSLMARGIYSGAMRESRAIAETAD